MYYHRAITAMGARTLVDQIRPAPEPDRTLVPLRVGDSKIYFEVEGPTSMGDTSDEQEVASRSLTLDGVLSGLQAFLDEVATSLRRPGLSQVSVEFSCGFTLESGTLFAVLGKAESKAGMVVRLEWTPQANS